MIPPAATTGTETASTTCGTSATAPTSERATTMFTPACSSAIASATVVAVPIVTAASPSSGGIPKVKLKTGTRSSTRTAS
jgi:hypothetical protein